MRIDFGCERQFTEGISLTFHCGKPVLAGSAAMQAP
jgi:hypothetical protein